MKHAYIEKYLIATSQNMSVTKVKVTSVDRNNSCSFHDSENNICCIQNFLMFKKLEYKVTTMNNCYSG